MTKKSEFLKKTKKDWRTRYLYVKESHLKQMGIVDDPNVIDRLISIAYYDPCFFVRSEAVRTCNLLDVKNNNQGIRLRKIRTLNNTLLNEKVDIENLIMWIFLKADIPFFPRKANVLPDKALTSDEWDRFYDKFRIHNYKVYDILDGYFSVKDAYSRNDIKNKAEYAINSSDKTLMSKYIYGTYCSMPKEKVIRFCKKIKIVVGEV